MPRRNNKPVRKRKQIKPLRDIKQGRDVPFNQQMNAKSFGRKR